MDVNEQLGVLHRLWESLGAGAEPDAIYREAIAALEQGLGATRSAVLLLDHEGVMRFRAWNGLSDAYRAAVEGHTPWAPGDPDPRPIFIADVGDEPTLAALRDVIVREGIGALAFIPLTYGGRLLGKFMVYFDEPHAFAPLDAVVAETVASDVGFALGRREIEDQLRESRDQLQVILGGVADGISVQDPAGRLLYVNEAAARLVGFDTAEEFVRTPLADVMSRFEVVDEAGHPLPLTDLPGRRALLGERVEGVTLGYRVVETGEERWSLVSAAPVFDAEGRVRFSINIFRDVTDRRRAEHALRFLADAGEVLGSSLDLESTLSTFTGLIVPALADWCIVDVLEADGSIRQLAVAHHDPERVELVRELRRRYPPNWAMPHPITRVLATGRPELASRVNAADLPVSDPNDPGNREVLDRLGVASHVVVPMIAKGRTLGALSLVRGDSGRHFDAADLPLAAELAARAAVAVENARLFHDASEAAGILRFQKSLLQAQNEASAEGILVTTLDREIVSINSRYRAVWSVPDEVVETRRHDRVLELAAPQARDPEGFLRRVDELYANPEDEALDTIELRDGRVFERLTRAISGEGTFYGRIWFYRDVTEAKRAEAAQRFLSEATETLNASLDFGSTLERVAHLAVPGMADASLVYLRSPDGEIRRVASVHPGADALLEHLPQFALNPDAPSGVPHVLRTGQPELRSDTDARGIASDVFEPDRLAELLEPYGLRSWMCVPMPIGSEAVGAIAFASGTRRYDEEDLALAVELARRAGIAVHNARLYAEAQAARERVAFLAEASELLSSSLDHEDTLDALARLVVPRLADWCAVDLLTDDNEIVSVAVAHNDQEKVALAEEFRRRYPPSIDDPGGAPEVLRTGKPQMMELSDELLVSTVPDQEQLAMLRALEIRSFMIVPLIARGRVLGALTLVSSNPERRLSDDDLVFAEELARRASLAVDNARLFQERSRVAETLQKSLLPPELPQIPGFEVAARYHPAGQGSDVGGDFYDVFETGYGRWAVVIGDVCGKGVDAAALTGLTRYTIRATARQRPGPRDVIEALNDAVLLEKGEGEFCTVVYAWLAPGPEHAELKLTCAGHPLPMMLRAGGDVELIGTPGSLVGVFPAPDVPERIVALAPGDTVILYTDGITERRRGPELFGEDRLRAVIAANAGQSAEHIAEAIEEAVLGFSPGGPRDDMALLVLKKLPLS